MMTQQRGRWITWVLWFLFLASYPAPSAEAQTAASAMSQRPRFIDAWFGRDFPLQAVVSIPLPGMASSSNASGAPLLMPSPISLFPFDADFPGQERIRPRPGLLALPFRETMNTREIASGAVLVAVEFEAVDAPLVALQFATPGQTEIPPTTFHFFSTAGDRLSQRIGWFVLEAIETAPPGSDLRVIGEAGTRITRIQCWPLAEGGPKYWRLAAIAGAFRRMLQRPPTNAELKFARRAVLHRAMPFDVLYLRLAMGDEFQGRFVKGNSQTRTIERLHQLIHARPILQERIFGAIGAWQRAGYDGMLFYLLTLESSVLDNPAISQQIGEDIPPSHE